MADVASISDRVGDLGTYLREQREHARLSVRQLATLTGVSNPYLSQVERGLRKPSAEVLQQIARGLRISAEALYVRAGILDDEGRADVEVAIQADPELSERQRRVLLDIYASFRAENRRGPLDVGAPAPRDEPLRPPADDVAPVVEAPVVEAPVVGEGPVVDEPVAVARRRAPVRRRVAAAAGSTSSTTVAESTEFTAGARARRRPRVSEAARATRATATRATATQATATRAIETVAESAGATEDHS